MKNILFIVIIYLVFEIHSFQNETEFYVDHETNSVFSHKDVNEILNEAEFGETRNKRDAELNETARMNNDDYKITGPRCIPLKGKNVYSNPYHPDLLSTPGSEIRTGLGLPVILDMNFVSCPDDNQGACSVAITKSNEIEIEDIFSVNFQNSETYSKALDSSKTTGHTNTQTNSISRTLENSFSKQFEIDNTRTVSEDISQAILRAFEDATATTNTNGGTGGRSLLSSMFKQPTESHNTSDLPSRQKRKAETLIDANLLRPKTKFVTASLQDIQNNLKDAISVVNRLIDTDQRLYKVTDMDESTNRPVNKTILRAAGFRKLKRQIQATVQSIQNSLAGTRSVSEQVNEFNAYQYELDVILSDTNTASDTTDNSKETAVDNSQTNGQTQTTEDSKQKSNERGRINRFISTLQQGTTFSIAPGTCKIAVCFPFVKAVAIPFKCVNDYGSTERVHVDYMSVDRFKNNSAACTYGLIDCDKRNQPGLFVSSNLEFKNSDDSNSLESGDEATLSSLKLSSKNNRFSFEFMDDGNLVLKKRKTTVWSNKMGYFKGYKFRLRINEYGHLIEEVKGLFNASAPYYRSDDWIVVWSSASVKHRNVVIGTPALPGEFNSYKLILENNGDLNLYDAVGAQIWCATKSHCKHRFGYKFPQLYLAPTNFVTPKGDDEHNRINSNIKFRFDLHSTLMSHDVKCDSLKQNEGLQSPNGRFKVILEDSGNLIIKDGYRTMWESDSGYSSYSEKPYELIISPSGNIFVLDANRFIIWASKVYVENTYGPYKLKMLDTGNLAVTDSKDVTVWETWPLSNMRFSSPFFEKLQYRYKLCQSSVKSSLTSNGDNKLFIDESLYSNDKHWSLSLWDPSYMALKYDNKVHGENIFYDSKKYIRNLVLEENGKLALYDTQNEVLWSSTVDSNAKKPFKLVLQDSGYLQILDKNSKIAWSYKS